MRDPLAPAVANIEIVPLDHPNPPEAVEAATFEEAVKEAFAKRPDLQVQAINVTNAGIDAKVESPSIAPDRSTLRTVLRARAWPAIRPIITGATTSAGSPIVGADGTPITVLDATGTPVAGLRAEQRGGHEWHKQAGLRHGAEPDLSQRLPELHRRAQPDAADSQPRRAGVISTRHAQRAGKSRHSCSRSENAAVLDVRNAFILLTQDRAQVQAASKYRELQQQTFDAEQKKYQLGASTVYNVILTQRDLINAQGAELRALANLVEAKANYQRAVGRALDVNRVTIADAKHGQVDHDTLIPGTLNGQVVGVDKIFDKIRNRVNASRVGPSYQSSRTET